MKITNEFDLEFNDCYHCLEVEIDFDYEPAERTVWYYPDGSGYPGCPAAVIVNGWDILSIEFFDVDGVLYNTEKFDIDNPVHSDILKSAKEQLSETAMEQVCWDYMERQSERCDDEYERD